MNSQRKQFFTRRDAMAGSAVFDAFDHPPSFGVCTQIGDYAADNYLRRIFPTQ